jgi:hypothetical protein
MRRKEKEIKDRQALEELLHRAPVCRIGLTAAASNTDANGRSFEDYPYVVPVHFVYSEGRIYIHSSPDGRKMDSLRRNPRVCVEVDEYLGLISSEKPCSYSSRYRSLIAFGRARVVEAEKEKLRALQLLMSKYAGRSFDFSQKEVDRVAIVEIRLEQATGKQNDPAE